jgi:hypothetical protein
MDEGQTSLEIKYKIPYFLLGSASFFYVDPDPNFHVDADPDPNPDTDIDTGTSQLSTIIVTS